MARGVMVVSETQADAEHQVLRGGAPVRILRSRALDLSGLPALRSGALPKHWVVVVEHLDPTEEAKLPQDDDPEGETESRTRQLYLQMAIHPELLLSGATVEVFDCPACDRNVRAEVPVSHLANDLEHVACPACGSHLTRLNGRLRWSLPKKLSPQCLFCEERADTKEHLVPEWISKQLGVKDLLAADGAFVMGDLPRRRQPISMGSYRARIFCEGCNSHFGRLEEMVAPLLVPMARGHSLCLGRDSQATLALWADKTAMALIGATPELREMVPLEHRRAVRAGSVADDTWVGFFPWTGGPVISTGGANLTGPNGTYRIYNVILAFARVAFSVVGFVDPVHPNEVIDSGERPPVRQLWPPKSRLIEWSMPPAADNRILPALLSSAPLRRA